ncbi:GTPase [Bradyrhizobium sp. PMVTL-01]|uniref:GTPase n=1 Tax=Bradyrhizobium sp. PMVTL-01 TaxID=3434999 RepID=UPI003F71885A
MDVYLVSGSFEERKEYAGDVLADQTARIVLCSMQYTEEVSRTIDYVKQGDFDVFIQWLNPGYNDDARYFDRLGLTNILLSNSATLCIRDGKAARKGRVSEVRQSIYGWARFRNLIIPCG